MLRRCKREHPLARPHANKALKATRVGDLTATPRSGQRHPAPPGHSKASLGPQAPQAACLPTHSPHNPLQPCGATTGPRLQPRPLHDASASAACAFTGRRAGPGDLKACQPKRSCQRPGAMQPMSAAACGQQQQQQQQQQKQHCLQEYSHKHGTGGKVARCVVAEEQVLVFDACGAVQALKAEPKGRPQLVAAYPGPDSGDACTQPTAQQLPWQTLGLGSPVIDAADAAVILTLPEDSPFTTGTLFHNTSSLYAVAPAPNNTCTAAMRDAGSCRAGADGDLPCTSSTSTADDCAAAPLYRLPQALQPPPQGTGMEGMVPQADAELPEPTLGLARPIALCADVDAEAWVVAQPSCRQDGAAGGWEAWRIMPAPPGQQQKGEEQVAQDQQHDDRRAKGFQRLLQQLQLQEVGGPPCGGPGPGAALSPAEPSSASIAAPCNGRGPADAAAASWLAAAAAAGPEGELFVGPTMLSEAEAGAGDSTDRMAGAGHGGRKAAGLHQLLRPWLRSHSHSARTTGSYSSMGSSSKSASVAWSGCSYTSQPLSKEGVPPSTRASPGGSPTLLSVAGEAPARPLRPRLASLPAQGTPLSLPMYGMAPRCWMPDSEVECDITFGPVHPANIGLAGPGEAPYPLCQNTTSAVPAGAAAPPTSLERYATLMSTSAQWRYGTLYDKHDAMMLSRLPRIASFTGGARGGGGGWRPSGDGDGDGGAPGGCAAGLVLALGQPNHHQQHHQQPRARCLSRFGSLNVAATERLGDLGAGLEQGRAGSGFEGAYKDWAQGDGASEDAAQATAPCLQSAPGEPRTLPPPELPFRGRSAPDGSQQGGRRRAPPQRSHTGLPPAALRRAPGRSLMGAEAMQALSLRRPSTQMLLLSAFGQQQQQQQQQAGAFRRTRHASLLANDATQRSVEAGARTSTASLLSLPLPSAGHQGSAGLLTQAPLVGGGGGVGWGEKLEALRQEIIGPQAAGIARVSRRSMLSALSCRLSGAGPVPVPGPAPAPHPAGPEGPYPAPAPAPAASGLSSLLDTGPLSPRRGPGSLMAGECACEGPGRADSLCRLHSTCSVATATSTTSTRRGVSRLLQRVVSAMGRRPHAAAAAGPAGPHESGAHAFRAGSSGFSFYNPSATSASNHASLTSTAESYMLASAHAQALRRQLHTAAGSFGASGRKRVLAAAAVAAGPGGGPGAGAGPGGGPSEPWGEAERPSCPASWSPKCPPSAEEAAAAVRSLLSASDAAASCDFTEAQLSALSTLCTTATATANGIATGNGSTNPLLSCASATASHRALQRVLLSETSLNRRQPGAQAQGPPPWDPHNDQPQVHVQQQQQQQQLLSGQKQLLSFSAPAFAPPAVPSPASSARLHSGAYDTLPRDPQQSGAGDLPRGAPPAAGAAAPAAHARRGSIEPIVSSCEPTVYGRRPCSFAFPNFNGASGEVGMAGLGSGPGLDPRCRTAAAQPCGGGAVHTGGRQLAVSRTDGQTCSDLEAARAAVVAAAAAAEARRRPSTADAALQRQWAPLASVLLDGSFSGRQHSGATGGGGGGGGGRPGSSAGGRLSLVGFLSRAARGPARPSAGALEWFERRGKGSSRGTARAEAQVEATCRGAGAGGGAGSKLRGSTGWLDRMLHPKKHKRQEQQQQKQHTGGDAVGEERWLRSSHGSGNRRRSALGRLLDRLCD